MRALDATLGFLAAGARWLALPVVGLLFAQWPLRELARAGSREANDLGQWLFALLVAVAITAATRAGQHLTPANLAARYPEPVRRGLAAALPLLVLLPWAALVLWTAWPLVRASVGGAERFPETGNPGYWIVKAAVLLLAGLMALQAALDAVRALREPA